MLKHLAILACLVLPTTVAADRIFFRELIVIPVRPIDANSFEVIEADGAGGMQMWCAAGIFSRKVLGQRGGDLSIVQARGPSSAYPGRKSVIFTSLPVDNPTSSYSTNVRTAGLTFSMTHAYAQCRSMLPERVVRVRVLAN
ncbi:MAG: hypothetical protein AAFZ14_11620 [Pseudomonadota bacterium]